ncbi:MAG TPA: DEAD/DEAH box helicase, partial [Planctomycetes bacterium]|nr:DEAD/DEAH box helicase [Planctomycetota bacterium]
MTSLRKLLPRTFTAFFHRFPRSTPIQAEGIEPILEGKNVLLCAPTASGKTEAYAAPLSERLLAGKWGPMSFVMVSPTRALANDLKRRLEAPMLQAGVSLGRYTGEHKERRGGKFPRAVVTTPEALDSLLARRPETLKGLRALVLDEVHILDGTARGDQVRLLLERLQALRKGGFQRVGASATVHDPAGVASRYGLRDRIVHAPGGRKIRARLFQGATPADASSHLETLARAGFRKILCFCNSRNAVETYASGLRNKTPFGDKVFAHHGSLAKQERERTERLFLECPAGVCFATLTLELGIDIGTVDYVLLMEPPPDVSSLLQRLGRGARRTKEARVGYVCAGSKDRVLFRVLLELASRGDLAEDPYAFRPGVLVQQALVLAGSEDHVEASMLERILPPSIREDLAGTTMEEILDAASEAELLEKAGAGRYVLSEKADDLYMRGL